MTDELSGPRAEVLAELKAVRERGYARLDPNRTRPKRVDTPFLEEAAKAIRGYRSNLPRFAAIGLLLKHAAEFLPEPYCELAILSFGLREKLDTSEPDELRGKAALHAGQSRETFKVDKESVMLGLLADQIVADCFQVAEASTFPPSANVVEPGTAAEYVSRSDQSSHVAERHRRRTLVAIAILSVLILVTGLVAGYKWLTSDERTLPGQAIRATVEAIETKPVNWTFAFPSSMKAESAALLERIDKDPSKVPDTQQLFDDAITVGAYSVDSVRIRLSLEGMADSQVDFV